MNKLEETILGKIRRLSNIQQALENLIVQCAGSDEFDDIQGFAEEFLTKSEVDMKKLIHHANENI